MIHQTLEENRDTERPCFTTPNGKVLEIFPTTTGLFAFRFKTGGELPAALRERFTHISKAVAHAQKYIISKQNNIKTEQTNNTKQIVKPTKGVKQNG